MEELTNLARTFLLGPELSQLRQLGPWAYALLGFLVVLEGPIAIMFGAVAAAAGWLNPLLVFIAASTGNLVSDILWYSLGASNKVEGLLRYGRRLRLQREHVVRLTEDMQVHAPRLLFLTKLTSSMVIPTLIAAGLSRVRWRRWFPIVFIAEYLRTGVLVLLGYYFGAAIRQLETGLQLAWFGGSALVIVLLGWYVWRQKFAPRYRSQ